jgi:hypothetical protein
MPASRFELALRRGSGHSLFRVPVIRLDETIARLQRLLGRLEEDRPYLRVRLSALGAEHRQSASASADRVRMEAERSWRGSWRNLEQRKS